MSEISDVKYRRQSNECVCDHGGQVRSETHCRRTCRTPDEGQAAYDARQQRHQSLDIAFLLLSELLAPVGPVLPRALPCAPRHAAFEAPI